jgi:hypothetical protein
MLISGCPTQKSDRIFSNKFVLFLQLMVLILLNNVNLIKEDIGYNFQFGFQDPGSFVMESLINLHHDIMFFLIIIVFKIVCLFIVILDCNVKFLTFHNTELNNFIKEKDRKLII